MGDINERGGLLQKGRAISLTRALTHWTKWHLLVINLQHLRRETVRRTSLVIYSATSMISG
ncbi:hypothetical protein ACVWWO_000232 [Bradyrhizobium sp. F1.13.1]